MKIIIAALNAKYVHTSLSVRCLKNAVKDICNCTIKEYTINDNILSIAGDIFNCNPDCVAFSCYIWNIDMVLKVSSVIKKANPDINIILGGHEVTYNSMEILRDYPFVDAVIRGEGEIALRDYLISLQNECNKDTLRSVTYRLKEEIIFAPDGNVLCDLNELEFPYDETIDAIKDRIIYYETSRGCPYSCSYCLSGADSKVRFLDTERVKEELKFFMHHNVELVKFVDRTFNANPKRAKEIFGFLADNPSDTTFHMEIAGDIIDDETIEILSGIKNGSLRFEIGVQTTNPDTMKAISRNISLDKLKRTVKLLREKTGVHIHLDLIAGLPYENLDSLKKSFDEVIALRPHVLQLGFLKMLKGSAIRAQEREFGYKFSDFPPYEVISNDFISYSDLLEIKGVENSLDKFYNSGRFKRSIEYLFDKCNGAYSTFLTLSEYVKANYITGTAFSSQKLYDILADCFGYLGEEFLSLLKYDYIENIRPGKRPCWFGSYDSALNHTAYEVLKDEEYKKSHLPWYYDVPAKEIMKHIHVERFPFGIFLFDYKRKDIYNVTDIMNTYTENVL